MLLVVGDNLCDGVDVFMATFLFHGCFYELYSPNKKTTLCFRLRDRSSKRLLAVTFVCFNENAITNHMGSYVKLHHGQEIHNHSNKKIPSYLPYLISFVYLPPTGSTFLF